MRYIDARDSIQTGDLFAVRSHRGGLSALTRLVTRSPYTHTAVALWLSNRLFLAEMNGGGGALVLASKYADTDIDIFPRPTEVGAITTAIFDLLGLDLGYDFGDLLRVAQHELVSRPLPLVDDNNLICSALSASIYLHAGIPRYRLPSIPTPRDVVAWLDLPVKLELRR